MGAVPSIVSADRMLTVIIKASVGDVTLANGVILIGRVILIVDVIPVVRVV